MYTWLSLPSRHPTVIHATTFFNRARAAKTAFVMITACGLAGFGAPRAQTTTATINANDVVINGESFFAASNIRDELNRLARADGVIGPNESFRQIAVSGAVMSQILGYYNNATPKPKYLITDGGGNDLMQACSPATTECPKVQSTIATVRAYFDSMRVGGTEKVLWMRYPDPQGSGFANLKINQDLYNPLVKAICDTVTAPRCVWVDLRPVWEGKYAQYTSDGIHATNAGGTATAEAFWKVIVDSNFFDLGPTAVKALKGRGLGVEPSTLEATIRGSVGAGIVVRVSAPGAHAVSIHDVSGRRLAFRRGFGPANHRFAGVHRAGLYFVRVDTREGTLLRKVVLGGPGV